jgi:sugar lactone lactonase YvrE
MSTSQIVVEGLAFPESPRWHDGQLWFSDMYARRVHRIADGSAIEVASFDDRTSGLGWLPDGTLLVALMDTRRIMRVSVDGRSELHCDLSGLGGAFVNDMVVDDAGYAYLGHCMPRDGLTMSEDAGDAIIVVSPEGAHSVAATGDVIRPNGMAISADGSELVVAEFSVGRVGVFPITSRGVLGARSATIYTPSTTPDGLCLDADGGIWVGTVSAGEIRRFTRDGVLTDAVTTLNPWAVACTIGGADRRTLYVTTTRPPTPISLGGANLGESNGAIESIVVPYVGVGTP